MSTVIYLANQQIQVVTGNLSGKKRIHLTGRRHPQGNVPDSSAVSGAEGRVSSCGAAAFESTGERRIQERSAASADRKLGSGHGHPEQLSIHQTHSDRRQALPGSGPVSAGSG